MPDLMEELSSKREELPEEEEKLSEEEKVEKMQEELHYVEEVLEWSYEAEDQGVAYEENVEEILTAIQACNVPGLDLPSLCTRYEVSEPEAIPLEQLRTELADLMPYLMEKLSEEERMPDLMEELSSEQGEWRYEEEDFPDVRWAFEGEVLTYEEVMAHLGSAVEKAQEEDPAYAEKVEKITPAIQDWSDLCETFGVQVSYRNPIAMI